MREIKFRTWDNLEKKFLIKNEKVSHGVFKNKLCEIIDDELIVVGNIFENKKLCKQLARVIKPLDKAILY